jgi:hypothetical protein
MPWFGGETWVARSLVSGGRGSHRSRETFGLGPWLLRRECPRDSSRPEMAGPVRFALSAHYRDRCSMCCPTRDERSGAVERRHRKCLGLGWSWRHGLERPGAVLPRRNWHGPDLLVRLRLGRGGSVSGRVRSTTLLERMDLQNYLALPAREACLMDLLPLHRQSGGVVLHKLDTSLSAAACHRGRQGGSGKQ